MLRYSRTWQVGLIGMGLLLASAVPGVAQQVPVIDVVYPYAIPYYGGDAMTALGAAGSDLAMMLPGYVQRPFDNLTPRPGAEALAMGGSYTARVQGPLALGWNPAGLAGMRERVLVVDGFSSSSSGTMSELPDTLFVPGQPEFGIENYQDRLGGVSGFGFAGIAGPLVELGGRPIIGGAAYRRHTEVAYGNEMIIQMQILEGTGFPLILGADNRERGAIYSYTVGLGYELIASEQLNLAVGASANVLDGRLRSEVKTRVNVRNYPEAKTTYGLDYDGYSFEIGGQAQVAQLVRLGGWLSLPYTLSAKDGDFVSQGIVSPDQLVAIRLIGRLADFEIDVPLFASGGVSLGPIKGITVSADVNYRPWSDAEIKYDEEEHFFNYLTGTEETYGFFNGGLPAEDVVSYHVGGSFEFPLFRKPLHRNNMRLDTHLGFRNLPLSMRGLDLVDGEPPYYWGDQVEGDAGSFGLSLVTPVGIRFHAGVEFQSYSYRKWFLEDTQPMEERALQFNDPWALAPKLDVSRTILRLSSEMVF